MESLAGTDGRRLADYTLEELDSLWDRAKAAEGDEIAR